jgi:diguanylate cyclase (GGDEF)-like protein/PAS domain S-box-containing protein
MDKMLGQYIDIINSDLFKAGPMVVFIWENKENWPVLIVSENIKRIYGYTPNDFISNNLQYASLIHQDDINTVFEEVMNASSSNTKTTFEHKPYRLQCQDNSFKWVHDTTQILRDSNNNITHYVGYLSNITELKELQNDYIVQNQELSQNIAFLKSHQLAIDESSIVSKSDLSGNITYANDNFCNVTGYTKKEVVGRPHNILRHPSNGKEIFKELWKTIKSKKVWKGILQNRGKDKDYWVDISILPILDAKGKIVEYIAIRHDITQMIQQQEILDKAANTDTLTGLGNRYKLNHDIKHSINPALAILNIDGFSQINDFYGHEKGDIVIKKLGSIIAKTLKYEACKLYHLQGDEFVVFNKNIAKNKFIENMAHLSSSIAKIPIILDDDEILINLSTAISFENKTKILITADMALKSAKKENKELVIYDDSISLNEEYQNNIKWAKKIKYALVNNKIVPVFQPIVNNITNQWEKYEALVRLEDNEKLISPYFFLEISKKTKHYIQITKVMIYKSFEMFKDKDVEFSINLTIEDILNEDIKEYIFTMLEQYKMGTRVVFEIVESESIENFEEIAIFIKEIKNYGCKIAIDDFGTGYSNFEYLMKVKADYIKIDGSMIKDIDTNTDAQMVVSTIVDFAKKMGIKTIAEFVENESILKKVKELEIDFSQGYYFSKPKQELGS